MKHIISYSPSVHTHPLKSRNGSQAKSNRHAKTAVPMIDYSDANINQQELEDYYDSITMVNGLSDPTSVSTLWKLQTDPNPREDESTEKEIDENEKEVVEESDNINFPDFPTYPPEDDIYKAPDEKETIG